MWKPIGKAHRSKSLHAFENEEDRLNDDFPFDFEKEFMLDSIDQKETSGEEQPGKFRRFINMFSRAKPAENSEEDETIESLISSENTMAMSICGHLIEENTDEEVEKIFEENKISFE